MLIPVLSVFCLIFVTLVSAKHGESHETCFHDGSVPECSYFESIKREIRSAKMKIWVYWKIQKYPKFLTSLNIPTKSWEIQKAKFIKLIVDKPKNGANQTFVVGFSGSSVTAGHDNYFYEAYPNVFYEAMLPVMKQIGHVDFQVLNHALGNNPCYPYDACTETHFGNDLDILTWEQTFNCGKGGKSTDTFARHANRMPKKPTVIYFESGGKHWQAKDCDNKNITATTPRPPETEDEKRLLHLVRQDAYKTIANSVSHLHTLQFTMDLEVNLPWGTDPSKVFSPEKFLSDRFQHLAVMGQTFKYTEEYQCYGPYGAHFCDKTPGGGGGWHPGKEQHKMRGDTLAYGLLSILEEAVQSIQDSVCVLSGDVLTVAGAHLTVPAAVAVAAAGGGVKQQRQLKQKVPEVPKSLQVPSTRQSASKILKSHIVTNDQDQKNPSKPLGGDAVTVSSVDAISKKITKNSANKVDETNIALLSSNHTNFRQSAMEVLTHAHATTHEKTVAVVTKSGVASTSPAASVVGATRLRSGVTTSKAAVPANPRIPETVLEMLGLTFTETPVKPFEVLSDAGKPCKYSESSKDDATIRKNLRVAAYRTVQQYVHHYLDSVVNNAKVLPMPAYHNASETNGPSTCYTDYEPRQRRDLSLSSQVVQKYSNWPLDLSFFDVHAVASSIKNNRGYLDRKMLFSSNGTGSQIVIKIHQVAENPVWICHCQRGILRYPDYMGELNEDGEFFVLFNEQNADKLATGKAAAGADNSVMLDMTKFTHIDVDQFGPMCFRPTVKFPAGDHLLVIRQKGAAKKVNLGYIVTF